MSAYNDGYDETLDALRGSGRRGRAAREKLDDELLADEPVAPPNEEFIVQKNKQVRQAGASSADGEWIEAVRTRASRSLYVFSKAILGRCWLTPALHIPACHFLTDFSKYRRKLLEMPRETAKSTIARDLVLHIIIQERTDNIYFEKQDGSDQRVILVGETQDRAEDGLEVIQSAAMDNELLRALWPHKFPEVTPKKRWNREELQFPMTHKSAFPDPTVRARGVGGAMTGSHPTALIKDDLIAEDAAYSDTIMQSTIKWHLTSRSFINKPGCLEIIVGTRWGINDLYGHIEETDPSVEVCVRALHEDGKIIYPRFTASNNEQYGFDAEGVKLLQMTQGVMYPLLYENRASDPSLVDFAEQSLRWYTVEDGLLVFEEDERDTLLADLLNRPRSTIKRAGNLAGVVVNKDSYGMLRDLHRGEHLRWRAA